MFTKKFDEEFCSVKFNGSFGRATFEKIAKICRSERLKSKRLQNCNSTNVPESHRCQSGSLESLDSSESLAGSDAGESDTGESDTAWQTK